jgi:hypothetical protein
MEDGLPNAYGQTFVTYCHILPKTLPITWAGRLVRAGMGQVERNA